MPRVTHDGKPYMAIKSDMESRVSGARGNVEPRVEKSAVNTASFLPTSGQRDRPESMHDSQGQHRPRAASIGAQHRTLEAYSEPSPVISSGSSVMFHGKTPRSSQSTTQSGSTWSDPVIYQARRASVDQGALGRNSQDRNVISDTEFRGLKAEYVGSRSIGPHMRVYTKNTNPPEPFPSVESAILRSSATSEQSLADSIQFLQILSQEGEASLEVNEQYRLSQPNPTPDVLASIPPGNPPRRTNHQTTVQRNESNIPTSLTGRLRHAAATQSDSSKPKTPTRENISFSNRSGSFSSPKSHTSGTTNNTQPDFSQATSSSPTHPKVMRKVSQGHRRKQSSASASSTQGLEYTEAGTPDSGGIPILLYNQAPPKPLLESTSTDAGEPKAVVSSSTTIPSEIGSAIADRLHDLEQRNRNLETALLALLKPAVPSTADKGSLLNLLK